MNTENGWSWCSWLADVDLLLTSGVSTCLLSRLQRCTTHCNHLATEASHSQSISQTTQQVRQWTQPTDAADETEIFLAWEIVRDRWSVLRICRQCLLFMLVLHTHASVNCCSEMYISTSGVFRRDGGMVRLPPPVVWREFLDKFCTVFVSFVLQLNRKCVFQGFQWLSVFSAC